MRRSSPVLFAGLAVVTIMALHIIPTLAQETFASSAYVSPFPQVQREMRGQISSPFLLIQGRHYSEYGTTPPRSPDFGGYYGSELPAYPPYASGLPLRNYIPYGWYDYYLRHLNKYEVCPPWSKYPYEC